MEDDAMQCEINTYDTKDVTYEEAAEAYADRKFWVSFFVRPCCPPPGGETAKKQLDIQRDMVREHPVFTDEQKQHLLSLIDDGEAWYRSTPYWSKGI
ncbi:MAG: hypothetical protein HFJ65_06160 [Eggerthellaceae bacterium]|nr:hypothetical protein [Eggerthellaceae bacterium]